MLLRTYLIGKIHGLKLTDKSVYYHGSITLSRELCDAAAITAGEAVQVVNVHNGERLVTYVMLTDEPGVCVLNGAAARLAEVGDPLIVMAFAQSDRPVKARVVLIEEGNRIGQIVQPADPVASC